MAYNFNGSNKYLNTASCPVIGDDSPFTMACWFKPTNDTASQVMLQIGPANGYYWGLINGGAASGDPLAATHSSNSFIYIGAQSTSGFTANAWNHACGIWPNNSSRTVYLNGGNSATNSATISPFGGNATEIIVGARRASGSLGSYFSGDIAEVGIWNAALTAAEVASLAKGMTCDKVRPQSLVFYAPLVRDLIDAKGRLTITNNNSATVAAHPRVYA